MIHSINYLIAVNVLPTDFHCKYVENYNVKQLNEQKWQSVIFVLTKLRGMSVRANCMSCNNTCVQYFEQQPSDTLQLEEF